MRSGLLPLAAGIAAIVTLASCGYCLLCMWAGLKFARARKTSSVLPTALPAFSLLKPLKGTDPGMYEALRSHCLQQYPDYEILFGVPSNDDPAVPVVESLMREFPDRVLRLIVCGQRVGANGKVSSLVQLAAEAKHELLLVNDSDIRVQPDYLQRIAEGFSRPGTGLVTCLYRGVPSRTISSHLESIGISGDFMPGILAARVIEGRIRFGLGSTLAIRRRDLKSIGGFEAIVDFLADDYELGRRIAEQQLNVELSSVVVETHLPAYDVREFFLHQLRWARTIRVSRPSGYFGLLVTFTIPWALAAVALARGAAWAWALLAVASLFRVVSASVISSAALQESTTWTRRALLPLHDLIAVLVWVAGWAGNTVLWRGERFRLSKGRLVRIG